MFPFCKTLYFEDTWKYSNSNALVYTQVGEGEASCIQKAGSSDPPTFMEGVFTVVLKWIGMTQRSLWFKDTLPPSKGYSGTFLRLHRSKAAEAHFPPIILWLRLETECIVKACLGFQWFIGVHECVKCFVTERYHPKPEWAGPGAGARPQPSPLHPPVTFSRFHSRAWNWSQWFT